MAATANRRRHRLARIGRDTLFDIVFDRKNDLIVPTGVFVRLNGATSFPITEQVVLPAASWCRSLLVLDVCRGDRRFRPRAPTGEAAAFPPGRHHDANDEVGSGIDGDERRVNPLADVESRLAANDIAGLRKVIGAPAGAAPGARA